MPRATLEERIGTNTACLFNTKLMLAKARRAAALLDNEIDELMRELKHLEMQQTSLIGEAMETEDED